MTFILPGRVARSGTWGGYDPSFDPAALFDLWSLDPTRATLGATLLASGTSPPVVTLTGTLTTPYGLRVEIQTTGALGVATFRASLNNGTSYVASGVVTAATYTVPGTSVVLNFPAGTYANDNIYQATVERVRDGARSPLGDPVQLTAAGQPFFNQADAGFNGNPSWGNTTSAVARYLQLNLATDLLRPFTILVVARVGVATGNALRQYLNNEAALGGTSISLSYGVSTTPGLLTPATIPAVGGRPVNCTVPHILIMERTTTGVGLWQNGVFKGTSPDTQTGGQKSFRLGATSGVTTPGGATTTAMEGAYADIRIAGKVLSMAERRAAFKYFSDKHAIPIALAS